MSDTNDTAQAKIDRPYKLGHDARTTIGNELVRGLMLINGGGALALLALVPQVWRHHPLLIPWLVVAVGFLAAGVLHTPHISIARIKSSLAHEPDSKATQSEKDEYARRWKQLAKRSALFFVIGCGAAGVGMIVTFAIEYCPRLAAL